MPRIEQVINAVGNERKGRETGAAYRACSKCGGQREERERQVPRIELVLNAVGNGETVRHKGCRL